MKLIIFITLLVVSLFVNTTLLQGKSSRRAPGTPIFSFSTEVSKEFVVLASFGYCEKTLVDSKKCCSGILSKDYVVELSGELADPPRYSFSILRNDPLKRIVVTLTGTKSIDQLLAQVKSLGKFNSFGTPDKKMQVYRYFHDVYSKVKETVMNKLKELHNKNKDYQVIFTGHSLGGAVATVLAVDSVISNFVSRTATSPALITFGQPRVGNFYFAQQVNLNVPTIFRVVRNDDIIASLPACELKKSKCTNQLQVSKFYSNESQIPKKLPDDTALWHIGGLILWKKDMTSFTNCGRELGENFENSNCVATFPLNLFSAPKYHRFYHDIKVGKYCKDQKDNTDGD